MKILDLEGVSSGGRVGKKGEMSGWSVYACGFEGRCGLRGGGSGKIVQGVFRV